MPKHSPEKGEIIVAPKKTNEIAEILCQQYLKAAGTDYRPSWQQRNWTEISAVSSADRDLGAALKAERNALREDFNLLVDQLIKNGRLEQITETKRGEIIEATIKKLAERPEQNETKKKR